MASFKATCKDIEARLIALNKDEAETERKRKQRAAATAAAIETAATRASADLEKTLKSLLTSYRAKLALLGQRGGGGGVAAAAPATITRTPRGKLPAGAGAVSADRETATAIAALVAASDAFGDAYDAILAGASGGDAGAARELAAEAVASLEEAAREKLDAALAEFEVTL